MSNLTRAIRLFYGPAYYARARSTPGVPFDPFNFKDFGVISTADADGAVASQDLTALGVFSSTGIAGALAAAGVATFATPRNVVAAWTGAAIITITGTDEYGEILKESSASGTALTGKKAFKTITGVAVSADVTALTVGEGNVIGLPHRVDINGLITAKLDNAVDAATFVPAVTTAGTATSGDIRGTVDFAADGNGTRRMAVYYKVADPSTKEGAYGVAQFAG